MDQLNHNKRSGELNPSTLKERDNAKTKTQKEKSLVEKTQQWWQWFNEKKETLN